MASVIDDFLTQEECDEFISKQKCYAKSIENHDKKQSGNSFQMLIKTGEMEDLVIQRITNWAKKQGWADAEKWILYHQIRLVHYSAGQGKTMHRDTTFYDRKTSTKSAYTCIVYLNEGFLRGRTITYPEMDAKLLGNRLNLKGMEGEIKQTKQVAVTPKTGRAVIYPIDLVHEGERVEGEKWLIIFKLQLPHIV
jgi:2OG-Fe(II) oxygenase superfamily